MIISITCRNGTDTHICRKEIQSQLAELSKFSSNITRIQIVFSKKTHRKNADDLIVCHLSIQQANRKSIDIYESRATNIKAFNKAKDRAALQLRHVANKSFSRRSTISSFAESELEKVS